MNNLSTILKELISERDRLNQAIATLQALNGVSHKGGKRHMSAEGRARIVAAQKKRWAKVKAKKK
jgi:hypothetical protein